MRYTFTFKWGERGTGQSQFDAPQGVALDSNGNIYVADTDNSRIQKFAKDASFIGAWGGPGTGNGFFLGPRAIALGSDGYIYVLDSSNHRIQKFRPDTSFLRTWGTLGSGNGEFRFPNGFGLDSENFVYVADTGNDRIQKFKCDGTLLEVGVELVPVTASSEVQEMLQCTRMILCMWSTPIIIAFRSLLMTVILFLS
jgi:DNA-binding beta-propeller fold protein YncE